MKLIELDPKWLMIDDKRIGFTFVSPTNPKWRQSCFPNPPRRREQWELFGDEDIQGCDPNAHWNIEGSIDGATFETMTVKPSLDGSGGGLWHGFITNGEIT